MSPLLVLALLVAAAIIFAGLKGKTSAGSSAGTRGPSSRSALPESLPVTVKRSFFSRSELVFFGTLTAALNGTPYTVFPNVRLNDIFAIGGNDKRSTYNRLRDKHVDFLTVTRDGYVPRLAIELDGASHEKPVQQARDRVKDLVFSSAHLALLRLDARQPESVPALAARLASHLPGLGAPLVNGMKTERERRPA